MCCKALSILIGGRSERSVHTDAHRGASPPPHSTEQIPRVASVDLDAHGDDMRTASTTPAIDPATPDPLFWVYEQIWRRAEAEDAWVLYYGESNRGEHGYFHPCEEEGAKATIAIWRPAPDDEETPSRKRNDGTELTDQELREELMTLAHEYGHFQSWSRSKTTGGSARASWKAYFDVAHRRDALSDRITQEFPGQDVSTRVRAANQRELTGVDRERIVNEEATAWRYGREILEHLGFAGLAEYDAVAETRVQIYRYRLGMVELHEVPEHAR
jgi:hypothetical protein